MINLKVEAKIMFGKNKIFNRLVIFAIIIAFFVSGIQLSAQNISTTDLETRQINITKGENNLERQSIRTTAEMQPFKQFSKDRSFTLGTDSEVFVYDDYTGHAAVVDNGLGNAAFFIELQDPDDIFTREIAACPSFDGGQTWDFDFAGTFPNDGGYNKLPALDFQSGMTAYGSWVSEDYPGLTCMAWLEDLSDPTAGANGWVYWAPDWSDNFDNIIIYSTDVACYDGPLNEEPGVFWGLAAWNGALDYEEYDVHLDNGVLMNYFSGEYIYITWFPSIEGAYNIQTDIDQSNGMMYWAYEVYNPDTKVNDLWIMLQTMEDWFDDESFPIWQIDGPCANPAIMAENGILCVAFESEGDLYCAYSSDNAESLEISVIADSGDDETFPDIAGSGLNSVCAFYKNGNLYSAVSTDGGDTWTLKDQLNDVSGTVANEYHCVNLLPNRAFWTDTRNGNEDVYSDSIFVTPNQPTIAGPDKGKPNQAYDFTITATHPEGGELWYWVDWGDGSNTGWQGPYGSGAGRTYSHTFTSENNFKVRAKAKTSEGAESTWAEHPFSTPRNKGIFYDFFARFPILKYLLGL